MYFPADGKNEGKEETGKDDTEAFKTKRKTSYFFRILLAQYQEK